MEEKKKLPFGAIFKMMIRPMEMVNGKIDKIPWMFSLLVSGGAFGLFFLLTGLDLFKTGQKGFVFVLLSVISGFAYGLLIIPIFGSVGWLIMKLFKTDKSLTWTIKSLCMSYGSGLIYGLVGLVFSLFFNWKVSIAFGMTGALWAIGPMFYTFRKMSRDRISISLILSTIIGAAVIYSWSFFGSI